jgi:hypothetical protein
MLGVTTALCVPVPVALTKVQPPPPWWSVQQLIQCALNVLGSVTQSLRDCGVGAGVSGAGGGVGNGAGVGGPGCICDWQLPEASLPVTLTKNSHVPSPCKFTPSHDPSSAHCRQQLVGCVMFLVDVPTRQPGLYSFPHTAPREDCASAQPNVSTMNKEEGLRALILPEGVGLVSSKLCEDLPNQTYQTYPARQRKQEHFLTPIIYRNETWSNMRSRQVERRLFTETSTWNMKGPS